jgi:GT2 family glycosyltransferase
MQGQPASETLAVIIPSANRPEILHATVAALTQQSLSPAEIILSLPGPEHSLPETRTLPFVRVVLAPLGLTAQRNAAIDALSPGIAVVAFLDDDVALHRDYLRHIAHAFAALPDLVLADGHLLADGVRSGGIARARAEALVAAVEADAPEKQVRPSTPEEIYGCNMSVRRAALAAVRFDERLPLYGYMEDRDFAFRCARLGRVMRVERALAVHLGVSAGRVSGRRFGFSQVMNPLYLWRKGSYRSRRDVVRQVLKPVLFNAAMSLAPSGRIDRRGRLAGNCRALAAAMRGRIAPEDVLRV